MARSTPTASKGTLAAVPNGQRNLVFDKIQELLTAFLSAGVQAWTEADVISAVAGSQDYVYHSLGNRNLVAGAGDTDIWIRLAQTSSGEYITGKVYQDWSPTSHTGYHVGSYSGGGSYVLGSIGDAAQVDWWCVANEYEFAFAMVQGGTWSAFSIGQTIRPFSTRIGGIARNTELIAAAPGAQTIDVDRDISTEVQVGQKVWLVNQTPDGVALQSVDVQLVTVTGVTATDISLDGITAQVAIGSLIGIDPQPNYVTGSLVNIATLYFPHLVTGAWSSEPAQVGALDWLGKQLTESAIDPDALGLYPGFQVYARMTAAPADYRGKLQHLRGFPVGTQANGDIMQIEWDAANQWWVFPSLAGVANWAFAIGPGATV
jgi:hypothetical protein